MLQFLKPILDFYKNVKVMVFEVWLWIRVRWPGSKSDLSKKPSSGSDPNTLSLFLFQLLKMLGYLKYEV